MHFDVEEPHANSVLAVAFSMQLFLAGKLTKGEEIVLDKIEIVT